MRQLLPTLAAATFVTLLHAQTPQIQPAVELARLGPQVGERVPDFELPDQNGRPHTLQSILGPNGAMLVFYRSAGW